MYTTQLRTSPPGAAGLEITRAAAVAERHGVTPGAVALAWVLRNQIEASG